MQKVYLEKTTSSPIDKEKSKQIDLKNQCESLSYQTKKQLTELEAKISAGDKENIENTLSKLESATQEENFALMETLSEDLKKTMMEIGQKIYSESGGAENANNEEVIETDFSTEK